MKYEQKIKISMTELQYDIFVNRFNSIIKYKDYIINVYKTNLLHKHKLIIFKLNKIMDDYEQLVFVNFLTNTLVEVQ